MLITQMKEQEKENLTNTAEQAEEKKSLKKEAEENTHGRETQTIILNAQIIITMIIILLIPNKILIILTKRYNKKKTKATRTKNITRNQGMIITMMTKLTTIMIMKTNSL